MTLDAHSDAQAVHEEAADRGRDDARASKPSRARTYQHADLADLQEVWSGTVNVAENLKGLHQLFKATFCDGSSRDDLPPDLQLAALTVADCMLSIAARIDAIEVQADARFAQAEARAAR